MTKIEEAKAAADAAQEAADKKAAADAAQEAAAAAAKKKAPATYTLDHKSIVWTDPTLGKIGGKTTPAPKKGDTIRHPIAGTSRVALFEVTHVTIEDDGTFTGSVEFFGNEGGLTVAENEALKQAAAEATDAE